MASDEDDPDYEPTNAKKWMYTEFDCPTCSANNPHEQGFRSGEEVVCQWCGIVWRVRAIDQLRFRLLEA